jgi:hypothetical protein
MPEVSGDLITRNYSNFRGVDFSNTEVALYRSPDAINMWKDYKKMGTSIETRPDIVLFKELKNTIYGLFFYTINQVDHMIIHCGVSLYDYNMKTEKLKTIKEKGMNVRKSQSFIYRNILYIKDGLNYLQYDGETCKEVIGYIPVTTIGKAPSGGGTTNQEVNLLTGVRENSFCADGESTEYVLDASELDAGYQEKVFINDVEKTEGFTVDKVSGKVKFTTAPEKPLTDGQDNVVIRFSKTIPGNRDKINKCTILEVFDNRVFFSGNQDYPNTVFHTMLDEPKYCSDLDYYNEGADISPVRGMVAGNNALWVIKEPSQANTTIFYHNPTIDSEAGKVYPSEHSSISTGCIGAAINFNDDIVYFSNRGMEGISGDITTEQVISHRSSLVDSKLLQEENYKDMILVEYEGYLLVIIKDKIYLADSRAMFTNENHNEYEWFYWDIDIEPTCAVVYNGELWLGSKQGIFKIGKASENNKEISMEKDEEERYFIDGVTKQETGAESYKTVTGKEILIEDGENNKGLEIKVKGSTTQVTRSGKNKLPYNYYNGNSKTTNGITFTVNKDRSITANGTATVNAQFSITNPDNYAIVAGSYKLVGENNTYTKKAIRGSYKKADGTIKYISSDSSFTIPEGATNVHLYVVILQGETVNNVTFYPMLLNSTETDLTFESGGASPSPDYPSPIKNIEGKNKFNKSNMTEATWDNGKTNTVTLLEDGRIQSTANYAQWAAKCIDIPNLKANTDYVVSGKIISSTADNAMIIVKGYKNNTLSNIIYHRYAVGTRFKLSFNSSDYEKIGISLSGDNNTLNTTYTTIFDEIQLEEGTAATDYVPYNSLEIKDVGENLYNKKDISGTRMAEVKINELTAGTYTLSALATSSDTDRTQCLVLDATNNKNLGYLNRNVRSSFTFTLEKPTKKLNFYASTTYNLGENDTFKFADIQIEQKTMATSYKPYQEQKIDFPLSEGQKLYEGSYLASDGIHNKRKQYVITGNETIEKIWIDDNIHHVFAIKASLPVPQISDKTYKEYLCNTYRVLNYDGGIDSIWANRKDNNTNYTTAMAIDYTNSSLSLRGRIIIKDMSIDDIDKMKTYLSEQYSNGTPVIVEYELSEEEIVPYTTAQQEAWDKKESMKLYDGVNHIESTSEIDIKYNYIYKKPSIKNKSNIENKISSGEYQTIINNKRYFVFLEEELKSVRNDITDRLYIDTNKNIAKVMKRVDKLVLNGTEEWNVNTTHSNVFYTAKPKNMADNETNIFCTITDEFSKDLSGETYGILIDTNINIKIPKVKTVADLKAYLAKEPITIQYKATEEIEDIVLLSKPSSYWTTCEDEFKYPQMQKTTNKRGCVADITGEEIDIFVKTNKEQFEKIATHKNATGYAVNRIKKKKWKSIQLKFSSNKSFELFSCTLESYIGSYIKR